jgi:hypothetical protein
VIQALPDGDYKPILGKYSGTSQTLRMSTGKGLRKTLSIARGDKQARDDAIARNFTFLMLRSFFVFTHPSIKFTALVDPEIMM